MRGRRRWERTQLATGFSVLEALVAVGLLAVAVVGLAQVFVAATRAVAAASDTTTETILAAQKVQQLVSLAWSFDAGGQRVNDVASDTAVWPEASSGGAGLAASPPGTLDHDTPGYVDHLDQFGRPAPLALASYTRRWSITPASVAPDDTLVVQVVSARRDLLARLGPLPLERRMAGVVRLVRVRTRRLE